MKITIKWQVGDGYLGKHRQQVTTFEVDKDEWNQMTHQEKEDMVSDCVWDDFRESIGPDYSMDDVEVEDI